MILLEKLEIFNVKGALRGMRNPMNSWNKADSTFNEDGTFIIGPNDMSLCKRLISSGTDHRKFMRQIFVCVDITAPLYWWKEFDTYKVGTTSNSTSTMHKIHSKPFEISDFSIERMDSITAGFMQNVIDILEVNRNKFNETKDKQYWHNMIQLLPSSYNQTRTITMSLENLVNMYFSRKNHKLQEWRELCTFFAEHESGIGELITYKKYNTEA